MNPHIEVRSDVVSKLVSAEMDEALPFATEAERASAQAYLARVIEYNDELNAARRRALDLLTLYGYLLPAGSAVGEVADLMPESVADEFWALQDRIDGLG